MSTSETASLSSATISSAEVILPTGPPTSLVSSSNSMLRILATCSAISKKVRIVQIINFISSQMDATELFLKQCKEAGADPNALLTFGLRKLKKVGPPKVSEYSSQFKVETGKVVGEQPAESDVDEVEGGGADIPVATTHNVVLKKPLSFLDDDGGKRPVTVERAVFATGCFWGAEKGFCRATCIQPLSPF